MSEIQNSKQYDLEKRTLEFARRVRGLVQKLPKTIISLEDIKQLLRSSGSVGSNYIEANESLSRKDFLMRVKISRKESKESIFWLQLLEAGSIDIEKERQDIIREATELMKIFGSIIEKSK